MTPRLAGKRVMIVEDELMIAMLLETALEDESCTIVGPFPGVAKAMQAATDAPIDFALLDVNVIDGKIYPIAERLDSRGIPFILLSGDGARDVPAGRAHWQTTAKPFSIGPLIDRVCRELSKLATSFDPKALSD